MFRKIKGQSQVIRLLNAAIENQRISQAYLFHGGDGVGKFMTALYFGMALNCLSSGEYRPCGVCASCHKFLSLEHPDFIYLFPTPNLELNAEGEIKKAELQKQYEAYLKCKIETPWSDYYFSGSTEIRKESISMLIKRLELSIREANFRVVIIENADMMNTATANAFLKTLEEPPPNTLIILITERLPMMLPTILSRCQPLYFKPLSQHFIREILDEQFQIDSITAKTSARISGGNLKTAIRVAQDSSNTIRTRAFSFVELAARNDTLEMLNQYSRQKETLNKDIIGDLIRYLGIIVNDLATVKFCPEEITNLDRVDFLQNLVHENTVDSVHDYLLTLDDLSRKLEGNINPTLIIYNLFIGLRNLIHPQEL
ncbi:MAG TPA: DNA polymerase III subunit delta' [Candidatus Cloacimonadota bacterium]|nr:DNA polymerase III subunit delta' [Candidatus Cloacimonadota bacterium]